MTPVSATHIVRSRLCGEVDAAMSAPILLIRAPAGFGKSTVLDGWIRQNRAGLRTVTCRFAAGGTAIWSDRAVAKSLSNAKEIDRALSEFVEGVIEPEEPTHERVLLVLDDLHHIDDSDLWERIGWLLGHVGVRLKVALLTRVDPPLPLYRWRLRGELGVVGADRLLFTLDETAELLAAYGVRLASHALRRLYDLTGGWPAALVFAVDPLRRDRDTDRALSRFADDNGELRDFLDREVLSGLSDEVVDLLRCTSIVDCVSADLLEAVTWRRDGARLLTALHRDGVLASQVGGGQQWYLYHPLLRAHLYRQARELTPVRLRDLHRAAADWYAANALPGDALHHALCAGAWTMATDLLDRHWPELLSGRWRSAPQPVVPAPPPEATADVGLALAFAVQRRSGGDDPGMRTFLRLAEQAAQSGVGSRLGAILDGVRLAATLLDGSAGRVRAAADRLTTVPVGVVLDDAVRALALAVTADACLAAGDLDGMARAAGEGLAVARRAGLRTGQLSALVRQSIVDLAQGRLIAAAHNAELAIAGAHNAGQPSIPETSVARLVLAQVNLERGLPAEARYFVDQALAGGGTADPHLAWSACITLARWHRLRGERIAALDLVHAVRTDPALLGPPLAVRVNTLLEADLCVADGQCVAAARLLAGLSAEDRRRGAAPVVAAKLALAQGRPGAAAALLQQNPDPAGSLLVAVEATLVRGRARWDLGDRAGAGRLVEEALGLAAEEGIRWPFLVEMPMLHDLLIAQLGLDTAHADTIVALTAEQVLTARGEPAGGSLPEPLTRRESAVLRQLNTMLSIPEIASALNVSANTVKTHMKSVYRKLDVGRRRDAVQRARELGLS